MAGTGSNTEMDQKADGVHIDIASTSSTTTTKPRSRTIEEPLVVSDSVDSSSYRSQRPTKFEQFRDSWLHKGNIANFISGVIMVIGLIMKLAHAEELAVRYVLSVGLFGFAGGVTNWIAVKMLFDKIPFVYGSGVIPRRFKEIRQTVKNTIMKTFFTEEYLHNYVRDKINDFPLDDKINQLMSNPRTHKILEKKLKETLEKPEVTMLLMMMSLQPANLIPMLTPFIISFGKEMGPMLKDEFLGESSFLNIEAIRSEIDQLMESRLELLTAPMVKELMEDVMRSHLSWLIIWGNIFGALIGFLSALAKIP
uniref:DUF445 domain-containing protein n=1 Tax=Hirondellea gigas TaxID=1518452 RepID=A0A6A7G7S2_9CRUS